MANIKLSPLLTSIQGSVGSQTFQQGKNGFIVRKKPNPSISFSPNQQAVRSNMSFIISSWQGLSASVRAEWDSYAVFSAQTYKSGEQRIINGYNLFIKYNSIRLLCGLGILTSVQFVSPGLPLITPELSSTNPSMFVAGGQGGNTLAYSSDGVSWTGLGTSVFSTLCYAVCYNGAIFVAGGSGSNTLAYSSDGISWTGLGTSIFSSAGNSAAWNGTLWVAGGQGGNTLAYSSDGISWTGLGTSIFSSACYGVSWNGVYFVALGSGGNTLAYSSDGISWTGLGTSIFSLFGTSAAWNGTLWVAGGQGMNDVAYSYNSIDWFGLGAQWENSYCNDVIWDGKKFLSAWDGAYPILYSYDGFSWFPVTSSPSFSECFGISYNGSVYYAVGSGFVTLAVSYDGLSWDDLDSSLFSTTGFGVFSSKAPRLIPEIIPSFLLDLDYDLQSNDYFALVKMSRPVRESVKFNTNGLKVVSLDYSDSDPFSISDSYYSAFGVNLTVGSWVKLQVTIFSLLTARVFSPLNYVLQVQSI